VRRSQASCPESPLGPREGTARAQGTGGELGRPALCITALLDLLERSDKGASWCCQLLGTRLGFTRKDETRSQQSGQINVLVL
jgi:hypothetical protein